MISTDSLRSMQCLESLDDSAIAILADIGNPRSVAKGDMVQHEGDSSDALYLVESGRISIEMEMPGQGNVSILTINPGDLLGWSALVPPHVVTASSIAHVDSQLIELPRERLMAVFAEHPTIKAAIYELLAKRISVRLSESRKQMTMLLSTVN